MFFFLSQHEQESRGSTRWPSAADPNLSFEHLLDCASGGGRPNQVLQDLVQRAEGVPVTQLWQQILAPGCFHMVRILVNRLFPLTSCRKRARGGEVKAPPAPLRRAQYGQHCWSRAGKSTELEQFLRSDRCSLPLQGWMWIFPTTPQRVRHCNGSTFS